MGVVPAGADLPAAGAEGFRRGSVDGLAGDQCESDLFLELFPALPELHGSPGRSTESRSDQALRGIGAAISASLLACAPTGKSLSRPLAGRGAGWTEEVVRVVAGPGQEFRVYARPRDIVESPGEFLGKLIYIWGQRSDTARRQEAPGAD